ncbi:hypothetical protein Bca4012_098060 [Brassica carinata]|uniref:DC1-like C-terminal domain-containing protein n=1 Tax=Brassica carinata TaxID=52824 RepID=A0A8X7PG35_BRACI|nr:hypothetical protein Bca52824_080751 [Brassica carinata]
MKPDHKVKIYGKNVDIGCNNGNSRPKCINCRRRIIYTLVFKSDENENFCGLSCLFDMGTTESEESEPEILRRG